MPVNYERKTIVEWEYPDTTFDFDQEKVSDAILMLQEVDQDCTLEWDGYDLLFRLEKKIERLETDVEYDARIAEEEKKERKRLEKVAARERTLKMKEEKELNERKALYELLKKEFDGDVE